MASTKGSDNGQAAFLGTGVVVGAATGGDKGAGTINVSSNIYKNNTAYTNPDYVFEHYYTGKIEKYASSEGAKYWNGLPQLEQIEAFAREHHHLPNIPRHTSGLFDRADMTLECIESLYLYAIEANKRIKELETICGINRD